MSKGKTTKAINEPADDELIPDKVITCRTCRRTFTQEAEYELDDYGDLIGGSIYYHDECPICLHRIPKGLFQACQNYYEGLLTTAELIRALQEFPPKTPDKK